MFSPVILVAGYNSLPYSNYTGEEETVAIKIPVGEISNLRLSFYFIFACLFVPVYWVPHLFWVVVFVFDFPTLLCEKLYFL